MVKIKDKLEDFDDSGYDTLKEENKYKKIADFHLGQMKVIQDAIHGVPSARLKLSEDIGLVPKGYNGKLCWNTNGLCDDERCYCE